MIRYVYVGGQVCEGDKAFAFFSTVTDTFISLDGDQLFDDVSELRESFGFDNGACGYSLSRFLALIPTTHSENGSGLNDTE